MAISAAQEARARALRASMEHGGNIIGKRGTADEIIRSLLFFPAWTEGAYAVGDVRTHEGQPYRCAQAHNSMGNPTWNPLEARALWANYHGTGRETALPWIAPTGAHDMYRAGECMVWTDDKVYRAKEDTAYSPADYGQAWEPVPQET